MKLSVLILPLLLFLGSAVHGQTALYQDAEAPIDDRVEDLLARMTVYEKIGQMTQLNIGTINTTGKQRDVVLDADKARDLLINHHIGSFLNGEAVPAEVWYEYMNELTRMAVEETRLGIPIIYGIDHIHGASYLEGSTIFPQSINLGATFNPEHSYNMGWVTAYESADLGHHWNFAPVLDLGTNPLWPRFWETFGEDPFMAAQMGAAYVKGLQENEEIGPYSIAATAKHFLAYSNPATGWDRTPVQISSQAMHEFHRPAFQAALDAGAKTVMLNSGEVNGLPVHGSKALVEGLLRQVMGFDGVVLTDWDDVGKLVDFHMVAENYKEATYRVVNAGVDMSMTPNTLDFNEALMELYEEGRISEERLDESVRRILRLKFELGLFEHPYPRNDRFDRIGTEESRLKALEAARESIVLLKNDGDVLPAASPARIVLAGPSADNKPNLSGGWTIAWQGAEPDRYPESMHTIYTALQQEYPEATITKLDSMPYDASSNQQRSFMRTLDQADMIVYAGGEEPYTEFVGNIHDLRLPADQLKEIAYLSKASTPLTLVLVQGRPRLITDVYEGVDAILFAGLPGFEGAEAIANVLSGKVNPSGKLPFSYPQHSNHYLPYNHKHTEVYYFDPDEANHISQQAMSSALFEFGHGLSYTSFEYSDLSLSATTMGAEGDTLKAYVTITNTGETLGMESLLWFLSNQVGYITRPVKELKHFDKITLHPGESETVAFYITADQQLWYPDADGQKVFETGYFTLSVGDLKQDFRLDMTRRAEVRR